MGHQLAPARDPACQMNHKAAQRIDIGLAFLLGQDRSHPFLEFLDGGTGIGDERAVGAGQQLRPLGDIVLVLDFAHNLFHQVLNCNEAVGPAEFVDHQRQMLAREPHLQQQIQHPHGRGDEQHLAQDRLQIEGAAAGARSH